MRKKVLVLIGVVLLITPYTGWSQEQEYDLGKIVVTAARTEMEATKAPGSISVVTNKDVEKRNVQVVDQALNTVSGVLNERGKGLLFDAMATVTLRGMPEQQRTLILMDGLTLNNPYMGSVRFQGLALEDIERIEVVRGPSSSLYGGYAMGGVINIITKMPRKREFVLKGGYGSDALWKSYISYGDRFKDALSLFLSYGYKSTDGYTTDFNVQSTTPPAATGWSYTTDNQGNTRYLIGDKGNNEYWDENIAVKTGYDFSQSSKINFSFMRNSCGYSYNEPHTHLKDATGNPVWSYGTSPNIVRESTFLLGDGQDSQNIYNLSYETELSTLKAKLSLGLVDLMRWNITPDSTSATRFGGPGKITQTPSEGYNSELQFTLPLFSRHIFTFGSSFRYNWADSEEHNLTSWKDKGSKTTLAYEARGKDRTFALFIQDELEILDNLTTYLGFREDWWETYDGYANQVGTTGYPKYYASHSASSFSPKVAIVYQPFVKTTLRTSIGQAFRPPTIYELYRTWTTSRGKTYAGNSELNPEKTTSWDLGIEQGLWKGSKIKATYFENYIEDLIYSRTVIPDEYYDKINAGKAEIRGIEMELEQRLDMGLRLFANLTYNEDANVKKNETKPVTEGKWLTDVPQRMFNLGVELTQGNFSGSLVARYVSKRYQNDENTDTVNDVYTSYDPYFVTDLKLSYKLTKFATLSFSLDNIFDKDYFAFYRAPGRKWFTELTLRF